MSKLKEVNTRITGLTKVIDHKPICSIVIHETEAATIEDLPCGGRGMHLTFTPEGTRELGQLLLRLADKADQQLADLKRNSN